MKKLLLSQIVFSLLSILCFHINLSAQSTTVNFVFTGAAQTWTVPPCVTSITVVAAGAKGGGTNGGNGSQITATIAVTPGDVIQVNVGGQGSLGAASGGWNGGGTGHASSPANAAYNSGGGGGASDIRIGGTALANRVIVAGGGGGRGGGSTNVCGGAANCTNGANGCNTFGFGGGGGTQTAGGGGGTPWAGVPPGGSAGTLGQGGQGGLWQTASGGGGGGGFYGGGGGGNDGCCTGGNGGGGGGGGSSLMPAGGTCIASSNTGNGFVNITYTASSVTMVATNTGPYCEGATIQLNATAGGTTYSWTGPNGFTSNQQNPTIPNATVAMSGTYTVTATIDGCEHIGTTVVNITPATNPTFAQVGPYCSGASIPALPTTSQNGISGTWSPTINNTATTTYTFTPSPGLCANPTTMTIVVNPNITPTFASVGPYCSGTFIPALPTTSQNGITGTWSPAINSTATTTYTFTPTAGQCALATTLTINITPNVTPTFAGVGPYCSGATIPALPTTSQNGITGTWSPAINNTATTTYTFTPTAGQCALTTTLTINITPNVTPTFAGVGPYCSGATIPALPTTSQNGVTGTWSPAINNTATTTYTFTPTAGQCALTTTLTINITPNVTPTFASVGPYCSGATIPALPTTSQNGVTGTWSPAINNTATTTYTFTPTAGQCALTTTLTINITPNVTPTFASVGPYCSGATIPALPTTSQNGVTGTWSPAINNTATTTYTFTPTAGQCALATTLTINITPNVTPTFASVGPYCSGATIPALPTTSQNGVTGTWSPAINNTATTTYTFTPTAGQCALATTLIINITPNVTPTFASVGPYCSGATIPALPTTSQNGVTGTWSPAINNTATTTYTFTPTAGLCALTTTLTINITPNVTPTFAGVGPYCSGATIPALPTTSQNGITGTWSPTINNTATTTYTFTPTAGQCALTTTLTINITPNVTPTFASVGPYCSGATIPALPTTSQNGVTGTWSPAINNTSTTTYTFTPTAGQCALATTLTINITTNVTPTFASVGPYCSGATIPALPTTSQNGFTGTWSPAINNTATTTYTFTPTAGQCALTTTLTINITPNVTPTFAGVGPYCSGATIPALPTTSQNGITGTWSPAINNTATTTYTFTPTAGQCALTTTLTINITPNVTPTFAGVGPYCSGATIPALPTTSQNGVTGTWSPAINNTATTTYTFTPTAGQCALTTTLTINITPNVTPTFASVGPYCSGATIPALPTTSQNGITGTWSPTINNTATTTYTFTPTAGQCALTTTLTININPNITPTFNQTGPFCAGASIPALPTTSLNGYDGSWSPVINNVATTTYTFTPNPGLCATSTNQTITINPNITPTFANVGPYCSGQNIPELPTTSLNGYLGSWTPLINNVATTNYTFTPAPGLCATQTNLTIIINNPSQSTTDVSICSNNLPFAWNGLSINNPGQHQAMFVNAAGCDSLAILNLTVLNVLSSTTNVEICQNQAPYFWNGLSLYNSGSTSITLTSSFGCDSIATLNLVVNPMPIVSFTTNIEGGCAPVNAVFSNTTNMPGSSCQWNLGNGVTLNNCGSVAGTYNDFGCYDISLQITSSSGCQSSLTQFDLVCVEPEPIANFNVTSNTLPSFNPVANFINTSIGHNNQIWNFGDSSGGSTNSNPTHTFPEETGSYYVTLVVSNINGCVDSISQLIIVENEVVYYVPNTFTPDGDLFNETFKPIFTSGFDIYQFHLTIFNRWGEIIFESFNSDIGWDGTYGGNICPDGVYIWQITYKEVGRDKRNEIRGHLNLLR
jgi:gliding motility-associated-like protein